MIVDLRDREPAPTAQPRPTTVGQSAQAPARRPRVVIVGAGFGGLAAASALNGAPVEVSVIDRRNYHLFQPLLYQVATAALSPADIAQPIRSILSRQRNAEVLLGRVTGIDTAAREVLIGERRIPYDQLVIATGARHAYFGHDEWEPYAPGLKKIEDATDIRRRILVAFEQAEAATDPARRRRLLTFVVVGGGATGVELAGAIAELAHQAIAADFRHIDPRRARVVLVKAEPRLLAAFPDRLRPSSRSARSSAWGSRCGCARGSPPAMRAASRSATSGSASDRAVGGGRRRLAGRALARRREGSRRPGQGRTRPDPAGPSRDLRHRRHRGRDRCDRRAAARGSRPPPSRPASTSPG